MRLFLIPFALIYIAVSVILSTVLVVGRVQPLPPRLTDLRLTDCALPCWIGITPGTTTLSEAKDYLYKAFGERSAYRVEYDPTSRDGLILYTLFPRADVPGLVSLTFIAQDRRIVDTILIRFEMSDESQAILNPSVGELYSLLGEPVRVGFTPNGQLHYFGYGTDDRGMRIFVRPQQRLTVKQPVQWLVMYQTGLMRTVAPFDQMVTWHGFITFQTYIDDFNRNFTIPRPGNEPSRPISGSQ